MALGMDLEEDLRNHDANRTARRGRGCGPGRARGCGRLAVRSAGWSRGRAWPTERGCHDQDLAPVRLAPGRDGHRRDRGQRGRLHRRDAKAHLFGRGADDVFYDGVAARADPLIDQWKRETAKEEEEND